MATRRARAPERTVPMADKDFIAQLRGYGLTTAEFFYRMPDFQRVLNSYIWQEYDLAPDYPNSHI